MQEITSHNNRSFIDEVVSATQSIHTLYESALANDVSITTAIAPGTVLQVVTPISKNGVLPFIALPNTIPAVKKIQHENQNIPDIATQAMGSIEHLYAFCLENGISPTEGTLSGTKYMVPAGDFEKEVVAYLQANGISFATGAIPAALTLFEPGLFEDGLFA